MKYPKFGDVSRWMRDAINEVRDASFAADMRDPSWAARDGNRQYWIGVLDGLIAQAEDLAKHLRSIRDSLDYEEKKDAA